MDRRSFAGVEQLLDQFGTADQLFGEVNTVLEQIDNVLRERPGLRSATREEQGLHRCAPGMTRRISPRLSVDGCFNSAASWGAR